jgi:hypothetical protein
MDEELEMYKYRYLDIIEGSTIEVYVIIVQRLRI